MNEWRSDDRKWCYFHPRELVVGICASCLKERLLLLAAKKNSLHQTHKTFSLTAKKSPLSLTKIFALTTLLNRLDVKDQKPSADHQHHCCHTSSPSPDDSFISIKFEDNGVASWEKGKFSEISHDQQCGMSSNDSKKKSLVEQSKPRGTLRWRRRIGHLFQLIRLKRSNKGNMCHVGAKHRKSKSKYDGESIYR
ncbi:hypothetical protein C2S51_004109 [Perilla frutescens var. frutescens]|nr:hypothetical protein C2S51_004109 [Perilla frutescens var. frutescens]